MAFGKTVSEHYKTARSRDLPAAHDFIPTGPGGSSGVGSGSSSLRAATSKGKYGTNTSQTTKPFTLCSLEEVWQALDRYQMQICLGLEDPEICHAVYPSSTKPGLQVLASQDLQPLGDACSAKEMPSQHGQIWAPFASYATQILVRSATCITSSHSSRPRHICNA